MSASHQAMWHGLLTVGGTGREIRWIAVVEPYKAYLDESHIASNEWCFVAGHLGKEEQWKEYDLQWRNGLGNRNSLHMTALRWNSKQKQIQRLLETLGPIPAACKLERIFGSVKGSHYADLIPNMPWMKVHFHPFVFAVWPCLIQTLRWLPKTERVIFTFEHSDRYSPLLSIIQESMVGVDLFTTPSGEHRAVLVPVPKGFTPRTEAADYLAFEMGQLQIDKDSFKAKAGKSILGDHMMIGAQTKRDEVRAIFVTTLALAEHKTKMDIQRKKAIRTLIQASKKATNP